MNRRYLVDTHVLLWYAKGEDRISAEVIRLIEDDRNTMLVSKVSLWEITIKAALSKLDLGVPYGDFSRLVADKGFKIIDFSYDDLDVLYTLPFHHKDPFDRLIIAQAIANQLPLISDDGQFSQYPVDLVLA